MAGTALERYPTTDTLHARALAIYSFCIHKQGNFAETIRIAEQSLQMARTLSDQQIVAFSLSWLGLFTLLQGSEGEGIPLLEQSLALYRALGDKIGQANTIVQMTINSGNLERATAFAKESLILYQELGDLSGIASSLTRLARLTCWSGDLFSPVPWLEQALSICRQLGDQASEEEALIVFGVLAYWQGNYQQANAYHTEVILLSERIGDHFQNLWAHIFAAYALLRQGEIQQARELFEKSIRRAYNVDWTITLVFAVEGLASLNVNQEQPERAARLFAWADAMRDKTGDHRPPIEQASVGRDLAMIHAQLDDATFEAEQAAGRTMTLEQAIEYALSREGET